mmetsp:Transcript_19742/g.43967  ORF Transcript_19742/g.43967 Transcript_19742/m.43967 type:complete len:1067 (+) Transcript_19742:182-3382(+)
MADVGTAAQSQPPAPQRVTPPSKKGGYVDPALSVEKKVVDELLLICGVIASKDERSGKIVPVTDCLNWLQDLQRALRRDDDSYRNISLLLSSWKIVQQKLLPLVLACRYDTPLVLTIVKILVILTKPVSEQAKRAGRLVIDVSSKKVPEDVIREQIRLRDNALRQSETLMEYKRLFLKHPSHLRHTKNSSAAAGGDENNDAGGADANGGDGLLSVFVSLLADPLSRTGSSRTDADHLTIELVLHLFRNLLCADPIMKGSAEASHRAAVLHQELISLFERELVLDVLLVLSQEMEARENAQYNLLLMEILHHLFRGQDPTLVATSLLRRSAPTARSSNKGAVAGSATAPQTQKPHATGGALTSLLQMERQQLAASATARHSHFGGTLVSRRPDGKQSYISAGALGSGMDDNAGGTVSSSIMPARRRNRKAEPFVGAAGSLAYHTRSGAAATTDAGAVTLRTQRSLHRFCSSFVSRCYGPVMKSLKNEFRRDSVRLEDGDKVIFFRIVWFFFQWWRTYRLEGGGKVAETEDKTAVGQLIFTMDVFTFNLVFTSTDTFYQHKKHPDLMQAVALYQEMMQLLTAMYHSEDVTEHVMALGLMDRIFYNADPIDRLPKLLSRWVPGTYTREYLCDLVELCHTTLTLLETNAKYCVEGGSEEAARVDSKKKDANAKQKNDAITRMNAIAAEFDFTSYFARKIVSQHAVLLYTRLLSQYRTNVPRISDRIAAFFVRLSRVEVSTADDDAEFEEGDEEVKIKLKTSTLEPLLWNIQTIMVLGSVLNDPHLKNDPESASLLSFASVIIRHYARAAQDNPMLHVESLIKHQNAHRFCESVTNLYVTDEVRMMVERDRLLDGMIEDDKEHEQHEQQQEERVEHGISVNARRTAAIEAQAARADISDDEGEVEFGVDGTDEIEGARERIEEKAKKIKISNKTLTEEEREKHEERRKKMAELAQKRKEKAAAENKDKGEDTATEATSDDMVATTEDDGTGSAPKRTREESSEAGEGADNDAVPAVPVDEDDAPKAAKRIKKTAVEGDDDSDDEMFGGTDTVIAKKPAASTINWDDDSDED